MAEAVCCMLLREVLGLFVDHSYYTAVHQNAVICRTDSAISLLSDEDNYITNLMFSLFLVIFLIFTYAFNSYIKFIWISHNGLTFNGDIAVHHSPSCDVQF